MTWYGRAPILRDQHHFWAPWPRIMHRGWLLSSPLFYSLRERASAVILSAAGAKDLLSRRCEGRVFGEDVREQQVRRTCVRRRRAGTAVVRFKGVSTERGGKLRSCPRPTRPLPSRHSRD